MRKLISVLASISLVFACSAPALGWGFDGHSVVGAAAASRVKPKTLCKINEVLLGDSLSSVASWADDLKRRSDQPDIDPDTQAFLALNKNDDNDKWHFVNLPLDCAGYDQCSDFHKPNDIVNMLNFVIRRLKTGQNNSQHPMSERNALRMLVHLVGDIHQPLHVGTGYLRKVGQKFRIVTDPSEVTSNNLKSDIGGNVLFLTFVPARPRNRDEDTRRGALHSFWDTELVQRLMKRAKDTKSAVAYGQFLRQSIQPEGSWDTPGDIETWAAKWASESRLMSHDHGYRNVKIVSVKQGPNGAEYEIDRGNAAAYDEQAEAAARLQLAKAGYRLAKLLDEIYD